MKLEKTHVETTQHTISMPFRGSTIGVTWKPDFERGGWAWDIDMPLAFDGRPESEFISQLIEVLHDTSSVAYDDYKFAAVFAQHLDAAALLFKREEEA